MAHWDVRKGWNRNKMEEIKRHVGKKKKKICRPLPPPGQKFNIFQNYGNVKINIWTKKGETKKIFNSNISRWFGCVQIAKK